MFCCHSFNCRCFSAISAISEQCGVFRMVVATVLPMVDSAADFSACSTDVHLSLAVVFVFTSEIESDTAARNIARCGSFTSKSALYRTCLGIRAFSIQPQTLNNCLRSSFATSNRWSLWSSVPEYDRESDNSLLCDCGQTTKSITLYIGTTCLLLRHGAVLAMLFYVGPSAGMPYCREINRALRGNRPVQFRLCFVCPVNDVP